VNPPRPAGEAMQAPPGGAARFPGNLRKLG
jgi:hypothetical protein